jgi:RNA polymerase sigma-70 factor (ECF subfamily)
MQSLDQAAPSETLKRVGAGDARVASTKEKSDSAGIPDRVVSAMIPNKVQQPAANPSAPTGLAAGASAQAPAKQGTVVRMTITPPLPTKQTDEQLLAAYRGGDRQSFSKLVERYQRELFHFLVRFVGDRAAAEDIFQESFLQVHQSAAQFDPLRRFRPWLFTIAANKARDYLRSQSRRPSNQLQASITPGNDDSGEFIDLLKSPEIAPGAPMEKQELQRLVQQTVMELPANFREILLLSYFHQFPYKQISEMLEIPLGTVKSRLHAAVASFADRWRMLNHGDFDS